ncbi:hypothetical protein ACJMK2_002059 [Sinanodonta woodiana]|uniref:Uncharacterized protein n=1 Tax=Sinanodonta woodiana TaxID=1069815 RepID=A0ABD3XU91_SINWO
MPSPSLQGTLEEGLGNSFAKDDLSNSVKADGQRKRRKCRVTHYRSKITKSANTSKKTEIDEFSERKGANKCNQVHGEPYVLKEELGKDEIQMNYSYFS